MPDIITIATLLASGGLLWFAHRVEGDRFGATLAAIALFVVGLELFLRSHIWA